MTETNEPDWTELRRLGLYDPEAENASERRELLVYLTELGVTREQMVVALEANRLITLAGDLRIRPGRDRYTREEAASSAGLDPDWVDRIWRSAGLPTIAQGVPHFSDRDIETLRAFSLATSFFGADAVLRFSRVLGTSMSRVAEAAVAMAFTNLQGPLALAGADEVTLARTNAESNVSLDTVPAAMDVVFRHHVEGALRRSSLTRAEGTLRTVNVAVAFLDLVGFTERSHDLTVDELAAAVADFETLAGEAIAMHDARLVKMIGDEVMYVATDPADAAAIALALRDGVAGHPVLGGLRGGLVFGEVVAQDGDYYGREVNMAARLAAAAEPGQILTTGAVATALSNIAVTAHAEGTRELKGFEEPQVVFALERAESHA